MANEQLTRQQPATTLDVADIIRRLEAAETALRLSLAVQATDRTDLGPVSPALLREAREALQAVHILAVDGQHDTLSTANRSVSSTITERQDPSEPEQTAQNRGADEQLNRAVLNSLIPSIAVLDQTGNIITVNEVWERFARENGDVTLAKTGIGANYLASCLNAIEAGDSGAREALAGTQAVLSGSLKMFVF